MTTLSPLDYAVISQALIAAAREMGAKLVRSAFSTVVREARDCSAALLERQGNMVAQAELIPMQLGHVGDHIPPVRERYPVDDWSEGDFCIINHPFGAGSTPRRVPVHSDFFRRPGGRVRAPSPTTSTSARGARSEVPRRRDVWQEGLIIPPCK